MYGSALQGHIHFHYLHHDEDGRPYGSISAMAEAVAAASLEAGIGLTLLPVFYAHAGFGDMPPKAAQRRFVNDIDSYARLHQACATAIKSLDSAILGIAPHSLRAVTPDELTDILDVARSGPVHIHIAEQRAEVDACLAWSGCRPVQWLLERASVDERWCLVHATHVDRREVAGIAASGAIVGLCPITEANLGDGIFPASDFLDHGGRFGVGSDSNVRIDVAEELRLLEYGQRLELRRRNVLSRSGASTGRTLLDGALSGGAQALGVVADGLSRGAAADIVALSTTEGLIGDDREVDRWIFARGQVDAVWRSGRQVVRGGRHVRRDAVERSFRSTVARLPAR